MKRRISVTRKDIEDAKRLRLKRSNPISSTQCPVALAAERVFGHASVGVFSMYVVGARRRIALPSHVRTFIHAFDAGKDVKPCSFQVEDECVLA